MKQASAPKRAFFSMSTSWGSKGHGFKLSNGPELFRGGPPIFVPPQGRRGIREYSETPVFLADPRRGRIDRDFEIDTGYWLISDRMKAVVEGVDPDAFAFLQCKVQLRDGSEGPARWLCEIVRVLDAVDEENSDVEIRTADDGSKYYRFTGTIRFRSDAVGSSHIFRLEYLRSTWACDEVLRRACIEAELTGLRFKELAGVPRQTPKAFPCWLNGNSHRKRGDIAAAIVAYGEAIRLGRRDTFYPRYFLDRAESCFALKDVDGAIADYDESIRFNPLNGPQRLNGSKRAMRLSWLAEAYWGRGKALLEKTDRTRAEQDFETARKLGYDRDLRADR